MTDYGPTHLTRRPLWSILMPSVFGRLTDGRALPVYLQLMSQLDAANISAQDVELVMLTDNRARSTGDKRQALLDMANGRFVSYVDDDDRIADDFVSEIFIRLATQPLVDVAVFRTETTFPRTTTPNRVIEHGLSHPCADANPRCPWMCHPWRANLAKSCRFPDLMQGEDSAWIRQMLRYAHAEAAIDRTLYYYLDDPKTSETNQ